MNPYNSLDRVTSDTIDFVSPDADVVRLVQLSIWKNRLDQRRPQGGESLMHGSSRSTEHESRK